MLPPPILFRFGVDIIFGCLCLLALSAIILADGSLLLTLDFWERFITAENNDVVDFALGFAAS